MRTQEDVVCIQEEHVVSSTSITLGSDTTLNTNATTAGANLGLGAVTGAGYALTLSTG